MAIILRKDFQRIRALVKRRMRKGRIQAELEAARRVERVVDALCDKIDFYDGDDENESETAEIIEAVLKEWGNSREGLGENEIIWYFQQVTVAGALRVMVEKGEVETKYDSYGRMSYRKQTLGAYE